MEPTHIESSNSEIPNGVLIPCPIESFVNRRAAVCCLPCVHFRGLLEVQDPPTWPTGYRIVCGHPIARRVTMLAED